MLHVKPYIAGLDDSDATGAPFAVCSIEPMTMMAIGAAASAAAPAIAHGLGIGKNPAYINNPGLKRSDFMVEGNSGDVRRTGDDAQGRLATNVNYGQTQADRGMGMQSRGMQENTFNKYADMANGYGPSQATAQLQQGVDRGMAAQMAMANSARGGSLAMAQGRLAGAQQGGSMLAGSAAQAAQMRMQEQQAGMAGMANMSSQQRAMDLQQQGMSAQQAQYQAQLEAQQRAQNDQYQLGMYGLANQLSIADQQGTIQYGLNNANLDMQTQMANAGISGGNAQVDAKNYAAGVSGAGAAIGAGMQASMPSANAANATGTQPQAQPQPLQPDGGYGVQWNGNSTARRYF